MAKSAYTSTSFSSSPSSSTSESEIEELSSKLPKHGVPYKIQTIQKNEVESEDGGGGWHQHVSKRGRNVSGNLSKSILAKKAYTSSSSSSDTSSEDEIEELSSKLPKHGVPYKIQSMQKNEVESEDGGGGWHQHVGIRQRTPSGNLSRSNLSKKAYTSSSSKSSSDQEEQIDEEKSYKLVKHAAPYNIQQIKNDGVESEDGGGGWHQHVSKRGRNISGNLSKNRLEAKDSSDDDANEKSPLLNQTVDSGNFSMSLLDNTLNGSSRIGKESTQVCTGCPRSKASKVKGYISETKHV